MLKISNCCAQNTIWKNATRLNRAGVDETRGSLLRGKPDMGVFNIRNDAEIDGSLKYLVSVYYAVVNVCDQRRIAGSV